MLHAQTENEREGGREREREEREKRERREREEREKRERKREIKNKSDCIRQKTKRASSSSFTVCPPDFDKMQKEYFELF